MAAPAILRIGTEVDLTGAAQMEQMAARTTAATNQMAQGFKKAGDAAKFNMYEARGSLILLGEEVGVRVPRHLQRFIAMLPGVGAALSSAFSLIAIVALVDL